ncbi:MAG: ABC transporter permease [Acidobacteriota bacterium]|nr:ABC transporter permease [Acidobacteriota bacterium]
MRQLLRRLRYLFQRRRFDADLAEELEFHRAMKERELERSGADPGEARFAASRAVGNVTVTRERARDVWIAPWLQDLLREPYLAYRSLRKSPGVTGTAVILIALVIGGNTTIYTMVHGFLTSPAPGVRARGLVTLNVLKEGHPVGAGDSYPNYLDYAAQSTTIRPLGAIEFEPFTLRAATGTFAIRGDVVSANYFETLGVTLARGRLFTNDENRGAAPALPVIISDSLWRNQLNGEPDVLGRAIVLNGHPATVVGIVTPGFRGAMFNESADVWLPLLSYAHLTAADSTLTDRTDRRFVLIGRLTPGVPLRQAQSEFATISARLQSSHPKADGHQAIRLEPYSMTAGGNSLMIEAVPRFLAIFSVVTILTLLIVCANIANLMTARAIVRQRELAVRRSLGASRLRIVRMLVVEAVLIGVTSWVAACLFALWVSHALVRLLLPATEGMAAGIDVTPDWRVVGYALTLAVVAMLAFMTAPALRAWHQDVLPALKGGERSIVAGRSRLGGALVVAQLAFSILLLVSAGLAYRSLTTIEGRSPGFDEHNLLLATVYTSGSATSQAETLALLARLRTRLAALPGVLDVSYSHRPPEQYWPPQAITVPGASQPIVARRNEVSSAYFATLGLSFRAGRGFTAGDDQRDGRTVVITQSLADALWPGRPAVGRTIAVGAHREQVQIVGVVPNALLQGSWGPPEPRFIFFPAAAASMGVGLSTFYVRSRTNPATLGPAIRRVLMQGDAGVPVVQMQTMQDELEGLTRPVMVVTALLWLFALGSLLIAAIGQYAAVAFDTRRRTREFGVRIALGASPRQVLKLVVRGGLLSTAAGLAIGFVLSAAAGTALRGLLYGVTATDTRTYLAVFVLLATVSLAACYWPARRAARIDPAAVLRDE